MASAERCAILTVSTRETLRTRRIGDRQAVRVQLKHGVSSSRHELVNGFGEYLPLTNSDFLSILGSHYEKTSTLTERVPQELLKRQANTGHSVLVGPDAFRRFEAGLTRGCNHIVLIDAIAADTEAADQCPRAIVVV